MSLTVIDDPDVPEAIDAMVATQNAIETEIIEDNIIVEETTVMEETTDIEDVETETPHNTNPADGVKLWVPQGAFQFLRLPLDVRLLIYLYFIPNATVHMIPYKSQPKSTIREDGTPCSPALLQICRQVYREVFDVWYSNAVYVAMVNLGNLVFLDHTRRPHHLALPKTLFAVRKLTWLIRIPSPKDDGWKTTPNSVAILEKYFSGLSTDKRLQTLHLQLRLHPDHLNEFTNNPESFLRILKQCLIPLRKIVEVVEDRTADMQLWWDNPNWEEEGNSTDPRQREFLAMAETVAEGLGMPLNPPIMVQRCGVCNVLMPTGQECLWRTDEE